jgi:hypothetical protein
VTETISRRRKKLGKFCKLTRKERIMTLFLMAMRQQTEEEEDKRRNVLKEKGGWTVTKFCRIFHEIFE